ncbi:MAG: nucleotidyltransferase domain-containing protein [Bryobacteraceae bacterium]|nr:nucleotidyltransferase domain-containing protein [Bryobacteraceae bacterium]
MSSTAFAESAISHMVDAIARRFSPARIILFGSYARGDAREGSDVDLMVLFDAVEDPRVMASEIYSYLAGQYKLPKDIIVSTTARFERYRNIVNTVYWPASREGKVLYERAA